MRYFISSLLIVIAIFVTTQSNAQNPTLFPGDVNNNGIVNHIDLLYLGNVYGTTGPIRQTWAVDFQVQVSGGQAPYTYSWSTGASGNPIIDNITTAGTYVYQVTITDAAGSSCVLSENVTVGIPNNACLFDFTVQFDTTNTSISITTTSGSTSPLSFSWDFGDGNDISIAQNPNYQYATAGNYTICATATDTLGNTCIKCKSIDLGNITADALICTLTNSIFDTPAVSSVWSEQTVSQLWDSNFPNQLNHAYADCDGNGAVDDLDVNVLIENYDQTHGVVFPEQFFEGTPGVDPPLIIAVDQLDSLSDPAGSSIEIPIILGTENLPIDDFYGMGFQINYDTAFIQEGSMEVIYYQNSWLNLDNAGLISVQKDKYNSSSLETSLSRINQIPTSGFGEIGKIKFIIEDDLTDPLQIDNSIDFEIHDIRTVDPDLNEIIISGTTSSILVTSTNSPLNNTLSIDIYPNPVHEKLYIESHHSITAVRFVNILGQVVQEEKIPFFLNHHTISVSHLESGIYFVQLTTEHGTISKKIHIQKLN